MNLIAAAATLDGGWLIIAVLITSILWLAYSLGKEVGKSRERSRIEALHNSLTRYDARRKYN